MKMDCLNGGTQSKGNNGTDEISEKEKETLKREARRRKILENAKNRLEKLNGHITTSSKCNDSGRNINTKSTTREYSDPEVEPDINVNVQNTSDFTQNTDFDAFKLNALNSLIGENPTFNNFLAPEIQGTTRYILLHCRLSVVLCALIASLMTTFIWPTSSNNCNIFIYLALYLLVDLLCFKKFIV